MTDAELISRLQEVLIPGNWGGSQEDQLRHVHQGIAAIIVALEANPPLAEVEGWIEVPSDLNWIPQSFYTLTSGRVWKPQIAVTVTIRKKHEG